MSSARIIEILSRNRAAGTSMAPPLIGQMRANWQKNAPLTRPGLIIVSCSDPRVSPIDFLALKRGDAAIIQNAGGRAQDAIRSIVYLDTIINAGTIALIHHTDCGTTLVKDAEIKETLGKRLPDMKEQIKEMKFGETLDVDASIKEDIAFLKASPLVHPDILVLGFNLDVHTGLMTEVKPDE